METKKTGTQVSHTGFAASSLGGIVYFVIGIICFFSCNSPKQQPQDNPSEKKEVQTELPSVIEIVSDGSDSVLVKAKKISIDNGIDTAAIYRWKNHLVLYDVVNDSAKVLKEIAATLPGASVKFYGKPFYIFDRKNCENPQTAGNWSHTIMTANLVNDTILQNEYMDYHATQFEKWPEVANGFCRADFQQLLVFRNARQLMLIISIPEGENLDELNPKTTENNPRVDEWNALMSKYQEGIEGSEEGSSWVTFMQIK